MVRSQLDTRAAAYAENAAHMRELVEDLRSELDRVRQGGGERAREKHRDRGKLLPRERIEALLDPGSPFLEFSALAARGLYDDQAPCAGIITAEAGRNRNSGRGRNW